MLTHVEVKKSGPASRYIYLDLNKIIPTTNCTTPTDIYTAAVARRLQGLGHKCGMMRRYNVSTFKFGLFVS